MSTAAWFMEVVWEANSKNARFDLIHSGGMALSGAPSLSGAHLPLDALRLKQIGPAKF